MSEAQAFHRGDVVLVALSSVTAPSQSKLRPAVIIQNDTGNRFSPNLVVAAISSRLPRRQYPTNLIVREHSSAARGAGLDCTSVVQAEVILTIPKDSVAARLGRFEGAALEAIDACLKVRLDLT
jgi:mRNA interferase MazF